jgi:3-hydroxybutyryl-CoA dehydratase
MTPGWRAFPEVTHVIGRAEIDRYAELSGDFNPLHMDADFAAATPFGTNIAHGPIGLQTLFEAVTRWMGGDSVPPGVRIDVLYRGPVHIGDAVTCRGEDLHDHAGDLVVTARCANQDGREVFQALVVVPRHLAPRDR